ncbi:MAG: hypothetical protein QOF28_2759 [Actinomycetota bacterium]|nr:hypothetical protein [Actinomycetota bacterium]
MQASARLFPRFGAVCCAVALTFATFVSLAPAAGAGQNDNPTYGYFLLDGGGGLYTFNIPYAGAPVYDPTRCTNQSCTSMAVTPSGLGYWILNGDTGAVYPYGTAGFYGDPSSKFAGVSREFVPKMLQIVATPGHGYWVYEAGLSDLGKIDHFGDAGFFGDTTTLVQQRGGSGFNGSPVGMAATADGKGYWEVRSDGGVFSFGDAKFYGSTGGIHLTQPIVGMTATADGKGYWLVAADGGVFAFGDAGFAGSMGGIRLNAPIVGIIRNPVGPGYWLAAADGGVFAFGGAPYFGTVAQFGVAARPIVAIAAKRGGTA